MKNSTSLIINVKDKTDIDKLTDNSLIKYINISIDNPDMEIIKYFVENGQNFSFSDNIGDKKGYIYTDYESFSSSIAIINDILGKIPKDINELETARYLYVNLGLIVGYDINSIPEKNDNYIFGNIWQSNNIFKALVTGKITNVSICKLYLFLCRLKGLDCEIITVNEYGYLCNKIKVDGKIILVDLTKDLPYIQANYKTKCFGTYNEEIEIDKKIKYIKKRYNDDIVDSELKGIDYTKENVVERILLVTQDLLDIPRTKTIELGIIYDDIFTKYCPNYNIVINNLYYNNTNSREHFILISYNDLHYSYNFKVKSFVKVNTSDINLNFEINKIGVYLNEILPSFEERKLVNG